MNAAEHLEEMRRWATGAKSWTNMIDDPAQVAVMDAAEVVKHGTAARVLADFESETRVEITGDPVAREYERGVVVVDVPPGAKPGAKPGPAVYPRHCAFGHEVWNPTAVTCPWCGSGDVE